MAVHWTQRPAAGRLLRYIPSLLYHSDAGCIPRGSPRMQRPLARAIPQPIRQSCAPMGSPILLYRGSALIAAKAFSSSCANAAAVFSLSLFVHNPLPER
jgi:hypothetical protein